MKATTKTGRVLAALAIGSLFVAACGSDDEAADTATEATEAPAEESEPEVVLASEECAIPVSADAVAIDVMGWEFPIITQYAAELKECEAANYSFNIQFLDSAEAQNQINLDLETGAPSYEMVQGSNQFIVELANKGLLLPLNDLVDKYRDQFGLDKIPQGMWDLVSVDLLDSDGREHSTRLLQRRSTQQAGDRSAKDLRRGHCSLSEIDRGRLRRV